MSPPDQVDGGHGEGGQEDEQDNLPRPSSLHLNGDISQTEPTTETSTVNSISPLQRDGLEAEKEKQFSDLASIRRVETPSSLNGFMSAEGSTPGSRASPDKTIAGKLKEKIRHFSGARTDSLPPPLDSPVTEEKFRYVLGYLADLDLTAIVEYFNASDLKPDNTLDVDSGKKAVHILCETENANINVFKALVKCGHRFTIFTKKGFNTLHLAVRKFNNELVKELLKIHPELVNIPDYDDLTPVHVAVFYINKEAFDMMLSHKADMTVYTEKSPLSPFHLAIKILNRLVTDSQRGETVQQDIHKLENIIETIVHRATEDQLLGVLTQKFPFGLEENAYPLHLLGTLKQLKAVRDISYKVTSPAVYKLENGSGETAFMSCLQAAWERRLVRQESWQDSVLEREIRERQEREEREEEENMAGRKKKRTKSKSRRDSLEAPYEIYLETCRYLLTHLTTDVDSLCRVRGSAPFTPLQMILYRCQNLRVERDLVESLLEKGADVLIENDYDSPINIVLSNNFRRDILRLFIGHLKPDTINKRDSNNSTVLHYAVSIGDKDFITQLLEKRADPSIAADSPDWTDVDFYINPDAVRPSKTVKKTPLVLSLTNGTVEVYLEALRRADISEVIKCVKDCQLLLFFQNHLSAAACYSAKEVSFLIIIINNDL